MPDSIPISAARAVAEQYDLQQVILAAWDGQLTHIVTYGASLVDCDQAAQGGDRIKAAIGWPESLQVVPSRVQRLQEEADQLKAEGMELQAHQALQDQLLRTVFAPLLEMTAATCRALDDSEEFEGPDGRAHAISGADFDEISGALDKLAELPDDKPGYTLNEAGRAEWALRVLFDEAKRGAGLKSPRALIDVIAERHRQIGREGWTPEHDAEHTLGEISAAAACYTDAAGAMIRGASLQSLSCLYTMPESSPDWPWEGEPKLAPTARGNLVKACALILAEIERLDRAGPPPKPRQFSCKVCKHIGPAAAHAGCPFLATVVAEPAAEARGDE